MSSPEKTTGKEIIDLTEQEKKTTGIKRSARKHLHIPPKTKPGPSSRYNPIQLQAIEKGSE